MLGQGGHLVAPAIGEVGEAVDHDDQRPLSHRDIVDLHAAGVGKAFFAHLFTVSWQGADNECNQRQAPDGSHGNVLHNENAWEHSMQGVRKVKSVWNEAIYS